MQIDQIIKDLEMRSRDTKDSSFAKLLLNISALLKASQDGAVVNRLKQALCYLQLQPVTEGFLFFNINTTLGEVLKKSGNVIINEPSINESLKSDLELSKVIKPIEEIKISNKEKEYLISLYKDISQHLPKWWKHSYPLNNNHEIMDDELKLKEWQESRIEYDEKSVKGLTDIKRDVTIDDKNATSMEDGKQLIDALVRKSNYKDEADQKRLSAWLYSNGGDDNTGFVDNYISTCMSDKAGIFMGKTQGKSNWFVEEGKIYFNQVLNIYSLNVSEKEDVHRDLREDTNKMLYINDKGNVQLESAALVMGQNKVSDKPLMIMSIKIELEIDQDKKVKPKLVDFELSGSTDQLHNPGIRTFVPRPR